MTTPVVPMAIGFITGYLAGAVPFAWIIVKWLKGVDIRFYGSRTVSGTMVGVLVSRPAAVLVGILDILKALVPVWFGYRLMPTEPVAMTIGAGAFLGHCWPVWLGFHGGRGVSIILGTLAVVFPWGSLFILLVLGIGKLLRAGGILVLIALAALPVVAIMFHKPPGVIWLCLVFFLLTVVKRLEANREPLPPKDKGKVLLRRLFLDRDIKDHHRWLHRQPGYCN